MPQTQSSRVATIINQGAAVTVPAVASIDWAIPARVRRITFVADQVLIPQGSLLRFAVAGAVVTTGYSSYAVYVGSTTATRPQVTSGLHVHDTSSGTGQASTVTLVRVGASNTWISNGTTMHNADFIMFASGRVALAGEATSIRFVPLSGNFTAGGTVQVMWEF